MYKKLSILLLLLIMPGMSYAAQGPSIIGVVLRGGPTANSQTMGRIEGGKGSTLKLSRGERPGWFRVEYKSPQGVVTAGWIQDKYSYFFNKAKTKNRKKTEASAGCVDCQKTTTSQRATRITVGSGAFKNYHKNPKVAGMIAECRRRYGNKKSLGWCLRGVRKSGQASGLFKKGVNLTSYGATAGVALKKQGFINLLKDPGYKITSPNDPDIPVGAILTYDGRNKCAKRNWRGKCIKPITVPLGQGYGHAEMKTADNRYCSDFATSIPGGAAKIRGNKMQGGTGRRTRRLNGVWVKPGL